MGINFAAMEDHLTRLIPDPVVHVRAAPQKPGQRNQGEGDRGGDEQNPDEEPRAGAFKPLSNDS